MALPITHAPPTPRRQSLAASAFSTAKFATVYGRLAKRAYDIGRKLSKGFMGLLKVGMV